MDIDECLIGEHDCKASSTCVNSVGSYTCACNDGFIEDSNTNGSGQLLLIFFKLKLI